MGGLGMRDVGACGCWCLVVCERLAIVCGLACVCCNTSWLEEVEDAAMVGRGYVDVARDECRMSAYAFLRIRQKSAGSLYMLRAFAHSVRMY